MTEDHLGGYTFEGDEATYFPELWDWVVKELNVTSILDVGCGAGISTKYFNAMEGVEAYGIDGVQQDFDEFILNDYTKDIPILDEYDLVWCCEFVEHVEEQYVENFLNTFRHSKIVLMTHAFPGQQGHHHVNCQRPEYWVGKLFSIGYNLSPYLTTKTRQLASNNKSPWNHYTRSGLAFIKS